MSGGDDEAGAAEVWGSCAGSVAEPAGPLALSGVHPGSRERGPGRVVSVVRGGLARRGLAQRGAGGGDEGEGGVDPGARGRDEGDRPQPAALPGGVRPPVDEQRARGREPEARVPRRRRPGQRHREPRLRAPPERDRGRPHPDPEQRRQAHLARLVRASARPRPVRQGRSLRADPRGHLRVLPRRSLPRRPRRHLGRRHRLRRRPLPRRRRRPPPRRRPLRPFPPRDPPVAKGTAQRALPALLQRHRRLSLRRDSRLQTRTYLHHARRHPARRRPGHRLHQERSLPTRRRPRHQGLSRQNPCPPPPSRPFRPSLT
mmetsp:Transcript_4301/g.13159  ORF Transcript_4301/g.13159 Transcript_4301/m.13159 type:complete len:315 (-) Transcript_4301:100-1044(-)